MANGKQSSAVRNLATKLSSANGRGVIAITPQMRKQMAGMVVVTSNNRAQPTGGSFFLFMEVDSRLRGNDI